MKISESLYSNSSDSFRNKTLQEYKNDYLNLVSFYKTLSEDNDEINFVNSEIRLLNEYIKPVVNSQKTEIEQKGILDLEIEMIKKRLSSYLKIISFLEYRKTELENNLVSTTQKQETELLNMPNNSEFRTSTIVIKRKDEYVFSNNGFVLFEHILSEYVKTGKGRLSDIHYFYWAMYNHEDKYIHHRPEEFKKWYFKKYEEDLGKIKTFKEVQNYDRDKHFSNALDWFKTINK